MISSGEGVQQGDPLGPLLLYIAVHLLLTACKAEIRICYLDDFILWDMECLAEEVENLRGEAMKIGLVLNESKCEIVLHQPTSTSPLH
jgi:hypothetical protein